MFRKFTTSCYGLVERVKFVQNFNHSPSNNYSKFRFPLLFTLFALCYFNTASNAQISYGSVNLGNLPNYFMVFTDGNVDANWQGATKGFVGNVAVNGIIADERSSGTVPYAGTITTNAQNLGGWQDIVNDNVGQASASFGQTATISGLVTNLNNVFSQINALNSTAGYRSVSPSALDNLNTQNGVQDIMVINFTSGFSVKDQIRITGDANDVYFFRWDTDTIFSNGYQGQVKFSSGGAFVPLGALTSSNFVHVAGNINASGGGSNPASPFPQGPRTINGTGSLITGASNFNGGGFFTGYWFTTGEPTIFPSDGSQPYGETSSLSNGIFVGGWYSKTTKFSMTSGTSGVYVGVPPALPVSWLNVSAKNSDHNSVLISWSTAQEINNDYFTVEKSVDGESFQELGFVQGGGNRSSISNYNFDDKSGSSEFAYYRIKQTDFNGDFDYSRIVMVNQKINLGGIKVGPNPADNYTEVNWHTRSVGEMDLQVTDMTGRVLLQQSILARSNSASLQLVDLPRGVYQVNIFTKTGQILDGTRLVISK